MIVSRMRAQSSPNRNGPTNAGISRSDDSTGQHHHLGHQTNDKPTTQIRIATLNAGGIPPDKTDPKNDDLWQTIKQHQVDVLLLTEVGINWSKTPTDATLCRRAEQHLKMTKTNTAHCQTQSNSPRQWGGTAIVVHGKIAGRVLSRDSDPEKCGRWASVLLQGKHGIKVRTVAVYIPTKSTQTAGTVYNQQAIRAAQRQSTLDPIDLLIQDLRTQIEQWRHAGESIIVGGDVNMDVRRSKITDMLTAAGLHEHHTNTIDRPYATMIRNRSHVPIDGIWTTSDVKPNQLGATAYGCWDHRMVWMDIRESNLFGPTKQPTTPFRGRRLQMSQPSTVRKYKAEYTAQAKKLQLLHRARELDTAIGAGPVTASQAQQLEKLDNDRITAMLQAESKCRRVRAGKVPFSPMLAKLHWEHKFWTISIKRRKGHHISGRTIDKAKQKGGVTRLTRDMSVTEMQHHRNAAWKKYKQEKKHADAHRRTFLAEDEADEKESGRDTDKYRTQILQREETKATYRRIKWSLQAEGSDAQVSIVVDDGPGGSGRLLTSGEDVAKACCNNNVDKYSQAWQAEVCQRPLKHTLGRYGTSTAATAVLRGIVPTQVKANTRDILQALSNPPNRTAWKPQQLQISTADHSQGWARIKESTSSGPSGVHFGCWKVNSTDDELATIDAIMREIPYRTGYSYKRWQQCVDIQLRKKPGDLSVTKTRTIGLMEGDYNMNNRLLGKQARAHAEANGTIASEQYGSRKSHTAPEVLLNTTLIDDIHRITGNHYAVCSNDAKGCYDRIAHPVFSLALQRQGVPAPPIVSTLSTIQSMTHRIRTSAGTSTSSYSGRQRRNYLQGLVQGLGSAPTGWLLISSAIIDSMRSQGHGLQVHNPITNEQHTVVGTAYVDDANIMHSLPPVHPNEQVAIFQAAVRSWDELLTATGGALEPSKSFWQLMRFKWSRTKWVYDLTTPSRGINMSTPTGGRAELTITSPRSASKYLGMVSRRDGRQTEHAEYLMQKSRAWAERIRTSRIQRQDVEIAAKAVLWPALSYSAPATTMSRLQWERVMSAALTTALPSMGIARTIARDYVFGHVDVMGFGMQHLYYGQVVAHLSMIMKHFEQPTATGRLLRASLRHLELWTGLPGALQQTEREWRTWTSPTWWQNTFQSAADIGITMTNLDHPNSLPREGDDTVMNLAISAGVHRNTLALANVARLHLRVMWLSDIATAQGDRIRSQILQRIQLPAGPICWPKVGTVSKKAWEAWDQVLMALAATDRPGWHIRRRLGPWQTIPQRRESIRPDGSVLTPGLPAMPNSSPAAPVEVIDRAPRRSGMAITSRGHIRKQPLPTTLRAWMHQKGPAAVRILADVHVLGEIHSIVRSIAEGTCSACSDASAKHNHGSAAAIIQRDPADDRHQMLAMSAVPEGSHPTDSNRAELAGVLMSVWMITSVAEWASIRGQATIACDNNRALRAVDPTQWPDPNKPDYDLWSELVRCLRRSPVTFRQQEVQGHADGDGRQLTDWEVMNVQADDLAGQCWNSISLGPGWNTTRMVVPTAGWSLHTVCGPVTDLGYWTVSQATNPACVKTKWCARWGKAESAEVSWEPMKTTSRKWRGGKRRTIQKLMTGTSASGKNMARQQQERTDRCPRCGQPEDNQHILMCPSAASQAIWAKAIQKVRSIVRPPTTPPAVAQLVCTAIRRITTGGLPPSGIRDSPTKSIQLQQSKVGWTAMLWGGWARQWREQAPPMAPHRRRRSPRLLHDWQASVTNLMWHTALAQWQDRNDAKASLTSADMMPELCQYFQAMTARPATSIPAVLRPLWEQPPQQARATQLIQWVQAMRQGLGTDAPPADPVLVNWMRNHSRNNRPGDAPTDNALPAGPTGNPARQALVTPH